MKISIIVSKKDLAGLNIKNNLIKYYAFEKTIDNFEDNKIYYNKEFDIKLYTINEKTTEFDNIDKKIDSDLFIYATKHESKSKIPSLSVHAPGNWSVAEMGGTDHKLCYSIENFMKEGLIYLEKNHEKYNEIKDFDIIQECTHHGPTINKPIIFIEIGSSEDEWNIQIAGKFISETIMYLIKNKDTILNKNYKVAIGLGGTHTTTNFKKIILNSNITISHVCPKYMMNYFDENLLEEAINKSMKKAELVILDWKGLGPNKEKLKLIFETNNIEVKKTKEF